MGQGAQLGSWPAQGKAMNITVIGGRGKLGSVIAAHLAKFYPVRIADKNGGDTTAEATRDADVVIVIVDTPSHLDGRYDICNVCDACAEIDLSRYRTVIISSTVNPGDTNGPIRQVMEAIPVQLAHHHFGLAYVPEFVRQGCIEGDFAHPAYVIAGCRTDEEREVLSELYETACGVQPTFMSIPSAEIMKIGLNTTITAKLAKANEIAWLCQRTPGTDARDVLCAIAQDPRVSPLYFSEGPPPGGPCFPRDDAAFVKALGVAGTSGALSAVVGMQRYNQIRWMANLVEPGCVGVAGLSFKPGYADATESPGVKLAEMLGAETYDPDLPCTCSSLAELVGKCDSIVLAMPFEGMKALTEMDLGETVVWDWWGVFGDTFRRFGKGDNA
jgi:UDPglucose 6-dehydrogenase